MNPISLSLSFSIPKSFISKLSGKFIIYFLLFSIRQSSFSTVVKLLSVLFLYIIFKVCIHFEFNVYTIFDIL